MLRPAEASSRLVGPQADDPFTAGRDRFTGIWMNVPPRAAPFNEQIAKCMLNLLKPNKMNKPMTNKMNSYENIQGVLGENHSIYEGIPVYKEAVDTFNEVVAGIEASGSVAERDTTGKTDEKARLKEELANVAVALASAGLMYAYDIGDEDLQSALQYSYTDLFYAKDSEIVLRALIVEQELMKLKEELVPYNVNDADLDQLHELIGKYNDAREERGTFKAGTVAANRDLEVLFGRADTLLKHKIDRMVWRYKFDHPNFYNQYQTARTIVDL